MKEVRPPPLNYDGAQLFYVGLWDPPSEGINPLAGVSEGMDYGHIDRGDWDKK